MQTKAYSIFYAEIIKQLVSLEQFFAARRDVSELELDQARVMFHRIKGGSGFFGLNELGHVAGLLEQRCKLSPTLFKTHCDEVAGNMRKLSELVQKMPPPVSS